MTRVCLLGKPEYTLQYELLSRETSRDALATYDLERPFENAIAVRTVSIGAAVSLLNDLQWYLVRFVDEALVQEPSVSETEWLSRDLAVAIRNDRLEPEESGEFLKIYGVESPSRDDADATPTSGDGDPTAEPGTDSSETQEQGKSTTNGDEDSTARTDGDDGTTGFAADRLVEPLYARRTDGDLPEYDLRDVDDTLVVRLTEEEFSP